MYTCPSDRQTGVFTMLSDFSVPLADVASNSYAACYGALGQIGAQPEQGNGVYYRNSAVRISDITDGTTYTIMIGERGCFFTQSPWAGVISGGTARTTPGAPVYTSIVEPAPVQTLARIGNKQLLDPYSEPYDFFSPHSGQVQFVFADGSARPLASTVSLTVLQALATRSGREPVSGGEF